MAMFWLRDIQMTAYEPPVYQQPAMILACAAPFFIDTYYLFLCDYYIQPLIQP